MIGSNGNSIAGQIAGGMTASAGTIPTLDRSTSQQLKGNVRKRLLETMDLAAARRMAADELHRECSRRVDQLLNDQRIPLSGPEKQLLLREVMDELFGLGPIEEFLRDPSVSDILVNRANEIYIERHGKIEETTAAF